MTLEQKLNKKKNEIGLVGTKLNFSRPKSGRGIEEHITLDWREIFIKAKQGLDLAPDEETKEYIKKLKIDDPLETLTTDLLYHGCGHRELPTETELGCPYNVEYHDRILNGIARALKEKGKQGLESHMTNAFEDVLDNLNARRNTRHAGQILFWNNEGLEREKSKFSEFYEAFVKINLGLWGMPADAALLRRFFSNSDKIGSAVSKFREHLRKTAGLESAANLVKSHEKDRNFRELFNKDSWEEMAYQFALATADLIDKPESEMRMCFGMPNGSESDFDKLMRIPKTREDIAYGRYKSGEGPSQHTDPQLQLDALYRKISRAIPVKTSEYTAASSIPVAFFGKRNLMEGEEIKLRRLKGVGLDEKGNLALRTARHELQHPATYKVHPRNFPKLRVALLDTSSSMAWNPDNETGSVGDTSFIPWGDNSKYHYALMGVYGIDNFLQSQGVSPYVDCEAVVFSEKTERSGRRKFRSQDERMLLLRSPSGGTVLDVDTLKSALSDKNFLVSVSDGDIQNWDSVKDDFRDATKSSDYFHIQIGSRNNFTQDLENWGIPVGYVKGNSDLARLMIDTVSKYYRERSFDSK